MLNNKYICVNNNCVHNQIFQYVIRYLLIYLSFDCFDLFISSSLLLSVQCADFNSRCFVGEVTDIVDKKISPLYITTESHFEIISQSLLTSLGCQSIYRRIYGHPV